MTSVTIEAEINPVDVNDLLAELKTIRGLNIEVLERCNDEKLTRIENEVFGNDAFLSEIGNETFEEGTQKLDTDANYVFERIEPIVEPVSDHEEETDTFLDFVEEQPVKNESPYIRQLSISIRKLDDSMVERYFNTRKLHFKDKLLQNIIDVQERSQIFPNAKEPVELPDGTFM